VTAPAGRLLALNIALLLASAVTGWLVLASAARGFFDELTQRLNRDIAMYVAQEATLLRDGKLVDDELSRVAHDAMVVNPLAEVYVLDTRGGVMGHRSSEPLRTDRVALAPVRDFLDGSDRYPIYGSDPRAPDRPRVFSVAEIRTADELQGYAYVLLAGAASQNAFATIAESHMLRAAASTLAIFVLLATVAAIALSRTINRPLSQLHRRVLQLGSHYESHGPPREPQRGGIPAVSAAVETLAARLSDQVKRLEQADRIRRDLFVNVSHDLRTPLTAMRCALDALAGTQRPLAPEAHNNMVEIALRHCERLNRLVGQIFSLARLNSSSLPVRRERVRLTELAQDILSRFQNLAADAKVQLKLRIDPNVPAALADIGMLETVLQNLLENALRHTPAGGIVEISVAYRGNWIETCVCDTGVGIPPDDLERVLKPFESGSGGGSGLGLAIVSKVLDLHGSALQIASMPRAGTEVRFRLPALPPDSVPGEPRPRADQAIGAVHETVTRR
jgi:signal transduction histidine kinase